MAEKSQKLCPICGATVPAVAGFCPQCGASLVENKPPTLGYATPAGARPQPPRMMEIPIGRSGRILRMVTYLVLCVLVGSLLAFVLTRFGVGAPLAIALVVFMLAYMSWIGWRTSKHLEQGNKGSEF